MINDVHLIGNKEIEKDGLAFVVFSFKVLNKGVEKEQFSLMYNLKIWKENPILVLQFLMSTLRPYTVKQYDK